MLLGKTELHTVSKLNHKSMPLHLFTYWYTKKYHVVLLSLFANTYTLYVCKLR